MSKSSYTNGYQSEPRTVEGSPAIGTVEDSIDFDYTNPAEFHAAAIGRVLNVANWEAYVLAVSANMINGIAGSAQLIGRRISIPEVKLPKVTKYNNVSAVQAAENSAIAQLQARLREGTTNPLNETEITQQTILSSAVVEALMMCIDAETMATGVTNVKTVKCYSTEGKAPEDLQALTIIREWNDGTGFAVTFRVGGSYRDNQGIWHPVFVLDKREPFGFVDTSMVTGFLEDFRGYQGVTVRTTGSIKSDQPLEYDSAIDSNSGTDNIARVLFGSVLSQSGAISGISVEQFPSWVLGNLTEIMRYFKQISKGVPAITTEKSAVVGRIARANARRQRGDDIAKIGGIVLPLGLSIASAAFGINGKIAAGVEGLATQVKFLQGAIEMQIVNFTTSTVESFVGTALTLIFVLEGGRILGRALRGPVKREDEESLIGRLFSGEDFYQDVPKMTIPQQILKRLGYQTLNTMINAKARNV